MTLLAQPPVKCFWLEPVGKYELGTSVECRACQELTHVLNRVVDGDPEPRQHEWNELAWALSCRHCGSIDVHRFSFSTHRLYRRTDTGEVRGLNDFGPGAMWDATWFKAMRPHGTVDGRVICVILPNGHTWTIDSEASNCTRKGQPHDCWCRHGEPPYLTVDKNPEPGRSTCQAGAGSIQSGDFHGFLRNGMLTF